MPTVQWRPEVNALTTPQSYRPRVVPHNVNGYESLVTRIVQKHPGYDEDQTRSVLQDAFAEIQYDLINGDQVTLPNAFTFRVSLNARLDAPDDPLPPIENTLNVRIIPSRSFVEAVRQAAHLERLPMSEKLPLINASEDTVLGLPDVLNPAGALRLTGNDLAFVQGEKDCGCALEGTRSGREVQSRFVHISNTDITFLPDIPAQDDPWNNEYILTLSTRYTEHGTLRTGIYRRRLRTPLRVTGFGHSCMEVGIMTDRAPRPYVTVTGGTLSRDETLRIQAVLDLHDGELFFSLLNMHENWSKGDTVRVTRDGPLTLPGFAGSAVGSIELQVHNFTALADMIRNHYSGRLVDVLKVEV